MLTMTHTASLDLQHIFELYKGRLGAEQATAIVHDVVAESQALQRCTASAQEPVFGERVLKRWPFLTRFQITPGSVRILRFLHSSGQPLDMTLAVEPPLWVSSSVDVSGLRCYDRVVDNLTYRVPRGISRDPRSACWVVRVVRNKQVVLHKRFADQAFGDTLGALEAAVIHLSHSGHAWRQEDVLTLDKHCTVHWRKRSGVGLCAVSYVSCNGPGRGETFFVSTWKRVESGRGLEKFRAKLIETLACAYMQQHGGASVSDSVRRRLAARVARIMGSERFGLFVQAGARKAERVALSDYLGELK